ncbi:coiled-coil protein associated with protofilament ribbons [Scenedesmus sp. NREL 46B-D3]|nr:coiled-coil protein associated with protofilament ribbons [Scenedesmus sp. NREL 46B-D3]
MGRASAGNTADSARLERILNAKQRLIGVDVEALNAQVEEKKQIKHVEQALQQHHAEASSCHLGMMTMNQLDAASLRKTWDREVQDFRATSQGKATTREWDLNRPDAKRQELPARLGDDDPRCGPASLQRFAGEDLTVGERTAAQREQCRAWWDEQTAAKVQQKQQEQEEKFELAATIRGLDSLQCSMMSDEAAARAELARQIAAGNAELRQLQAATRDAERQKELRAKLTELEAAKQDPWLNEDPQQAASAMSPARVRKDHWKGMSAAQRDAITQEQLGQVLARRAAAAQAAAEEAAAAAEQHSIHKAVMQQAQAAGDFRRKQAAAAAEVLRRQVEEKAARDAQVKETYSNKVSDSYYAQFGTSHR